jgi:hypothetical protein
MKMKNKLKKYNYYVKNINKIMESIKYLIKHLIKY